MNIKDLIGEATEYDKKLALEEKKPKSWCKSVSAFANTFGGALIFGISDDDQVVGLEDPKGDADKISETIKTRLDPIPEFKLRFHKTEDGKVLVILDVCKGDETPYYYLGDGVLEAYVRVGNESVKVTATELKRLVLRGKNTSYDSQNSTYKVEDYAFLKLKERYKKWTGNSFDDKDLISFGLVNEQGKLTNAGALLADENPILCSRLFCTRWNGLNKSGGAFDALDDAEYSSSVISLIENGEAFIKRNRLGYMERKGSGFGKIISGYEFQINYSENKRPSFRSDRYQFTVVMPNLNYDVPQGVPQDVPQGVPQDKLDVQIIDLIHKDNKISTEKIAVALGVSSKTIKRHIKEMDNVTYVGSGFSGHWEIKDNE